MKILYSTCPLRQNGVETREELIQKEKEHLEKYQAESFRDACESIIRAKPLYDHPGYTHVVRDN